MKKLVAIFMAAIMVFALAACNNSENNSEENNENNTAKKVETTVEAISENGDAELKAEFTELKDNGIDIGDTVAITAGNFSGEAKLADEFDENSDDVQLFYNETDGVVAICVAGADFCELNSIEENAKVTLEEK